MRKLLLVDLDGTIREPIQGKFINTPKNQRLMPNVKRTLREYYQNKWDIVGISNQLGVEKGYKTLDDCVREQQYTMLLSEYMRSVYFCIDEGNTCVLTTNLAAIVNKVLPFISPLYLTKASHEKKFRKPDTGMLLEAVDNFWKINSDTLTAADSKYALENKLFNVMYVGDMETDKQAAESLDIDFKWAKEFFNR